MTVNRQDNIDFLATELDVTNAETLIYEVSFKGAQAIFAVSDQHGTIILSPSDPSVAAGCWRKTWPTSPEDVKVPDDLNHVLGIHFTGGATQYAYKVTRCDKTGTIIATCKDCVYTNTSPTDSFFEPLRVFTF